MSPPTPFRWRNTFCGCVSICPSEKIVHTTPPIFERLIPQTLHDALWWKGSYKRGTAVLLYVDLHHCASLMGHFEGVISLFD
jgi:hypothetical protein